MKLDRSEIKAQTNINNRNSIDTVIVSNVSSRKKTFVFGHLCNQ